MPSRILESFVVRLLVANILFFVAITVAGGGYQIVDWYQAYIGLDRQVEQDDLEWAVMFLEEHRNAGSYSHSHKDYKEYQRSLDIVIRYLLAKQALQNHQFRQDR